MRVEYKVNDRITIAAEGETPQDIFKQISRLQESFGEEECGKCHSKKLTFTHRVSSEYDFYELKCQDCYAKLEFGQGKDKFYPKRMVVDAKGKTIKDANGKGEYRPDRGWFKYNKETGETE